MFESAAAYCWGIIKNHPFIDGNKRASLLAAAVFLDLNGYDFQPEETEIVHVIRGLAAGELGEADLAVWLSDNSLRKRGPGR